MKRNKSYINIFLDKEMSRIIRIDDLYNNHSNLLCAPVVL